MTNQQHPITPPPELVEQWRQEHTTTYNLARQAARWGADQELEAVEEEIITQGWFANSTHRRAELRAARRSKPPSLKEQALSEVAAAVAGGNITPERGAIIRVALEALPK